MSLASYLLLHSAAGRCYRNGSGSASKGDADGAQEEGLEAQPMETQADPKGQTTRSCGRRVFVERSDVFGELRCAFLDVPVHFGRLRE